MQIPTASLKLKTKKVTTKTAGPIKATANVSSSTAVVSSSTVQTLPKQSKQTITKRPSSSKPLQTKTGVKLDDSLQ